MRVAYALGRLATLAIAAVVSCSSDPASQGAGGGPSGGGTSAGSGGTAGASGGGSGGVAGSAGSGGAFPAAYSTQIFDRVRIESHADKENFQSATSELEFKDGPFERVMLVVDLDTTCYPFDSWLGPTPTNPPPDGENWPADCDAFDRNFEFTLDDPQLETDPPGIELARAITPFGGPLHFEIDITDVANGVGPGSHRLRTHISTWSDGAGTVSGSDGGWFVSAKIEATPGKAPRQVLAVIPLYNGSHGATMPPAVAFEVPAGTLSNRVEYRATGHGGVYPSPGCSQPGEEFCRRDHRVSADGSQFDRFVPWRSDCKDLCTRATYGSLEYCAENPCGAIQSVEAARAGWCPGSVSPPFTWERPEYNTPGSHSFSWSISPVADGGSWRISATYFAFGAE